MFLQDFMHSQIMWVVISNSNITIRPLLQAQSPENQRNCALAGPHRQQAPRLLPKISWFLLLDKLCTH